MNPALQPLLQPRDALRPPSADSPRVGVALSALAHLGLLTALTLGVQWRTESPEGVEAELWAAVPQIAAPAAAATESPQESSPPPAPAQAAEPPPPPATQRPPEPSQQEADLAETRAQQQRLAQERREAQDRKARERREQEDRAREAAKARREQQQREDAKAEKERQDKARQAQAQEDKARQQALARDKARQEAAAEAAREKARQDQLRRMNAQLGGTGAPDARGTAAQDAGPSANYAGRIKGRIRPNIVLIDPVSGNPQAEAELRVAPDGSIIGRRLTQPSGNAAWDEAVLRAIDRTGVLPRDTDGRVPSRILITFRPQD